MKFTENSLFVGVLLLVLLAGLVFYGSEYYSERTAPKVPVALPVTTTESTSSTTTSSSATTSSTQSTVTTQVTYQTTTSSSITSTSSSSTSTSLPTPSYLDRFRGKGYHQVFLSVHYFCPSCVAAVAQTVQKEPGVMGKSLGWKQKESWVIYNPKVVSLERVLELASSSGGAEIINDTVV